MKTITKYGFLIYVSALCLVWTGGPSAQAKNTLNCTIVDEEGKPVAKQEFLLTSAGGKQTKKKTGDQGDLKFTGLDDGSYTLGGEALVPSKYEVSGNTEIACKYTVVSAASANAKLQEVMQLVQQKKYAEAEEKSKKLVEIMPNEGASHYVLAVAYAYQGNEAAGAEVKKAAELSPDKFQKNVVPIQMQALNIEAEQAKQKGDYPGAIKKYESMLAVAPNDPIAYYNMAVTYGRAGNFDQALKSIDKAIQLKPDDAESQRLKIQLQDSYLKQMDQKLEKK